MHVILSEQASDSEVYVGKDAFKLIAKGCLRGVELIPFPSLIKFSGHVTIMIAAIFNCLERLVYGGVREDLQLKFALLQAFRDMRVGRFEWWRKTRVVVNGQDGRHTKDDRSSSQKTRGRGLLLTRRDGWCKCCDIRRREKLQTRVLREARDQNPL